MIEIFNTISNWFSGNYGWLWLTAFSVIFRAIYGVMTKVLANKVKTSVYTQVTLLPLSGAVMAVMMAPLLGGLNFNFLNVSLFVVLLVMLGQGLGNITYFVAIKNLTNGTAPIPDFHQNPNS